MPASFTIPSIFTAVDKLSRPVKNMAGNVESFAARTERSFRKVGDDSLRVARTGFIIGSALAVPLGIAAKQAVDFESKMSNVATIVDTSAESMADMGQQALNVLRRVPVTADDLTTSLYDIRSAGIDASQAMSTLEQSSRLSVAGLSSASEATNIMTSAVNAFASEGKTAQEISNILFKTVKAGKTNISQLAQAFGSTAPIIQSAGVTLADFQAATAAITKLGTPAAQAQTQLRASVIALQKPTAEMSKIFKRLGVTTDRELIEKFGGLGGAFEAINTQGAKMRVNMAKAWSSTEALAAVTSITGAVSKDYVEILGDMTTGANAVDEAFNKQLKTGANQMQIARNNMQALAITVGTELIPVITSTVQKITPVIQRFVDWGKENPRTMKTLVLFTTAIAAFAFTVSGVAFAISIVTKAMAAWGIITKLFTAAQWLLNVAMTANPIGAIIVGIAALIAVIALAIAKYNEWGAALLLILGPLGWIINLIQSFRRNWDLITQAFREGGILAGLKMIGATLLDAVLMPIQQIVELIANITGATWAENAVKSIQKFRADLGVNTTTDESGQPLPNAPAINPEAARQEALTNRTETTNRQNVAIDIRDQTGRASVQSDDDLVPISLTSTMGF